MRELLKRFWHEEDGMGTIEIVIIIAVLVSIALLFKKEITSFAKNLMETFFDEKKVSVDYTTEDGG